MSIRGTTQRALLLKLNCQSMSAFEDWPRLYRLYPQNSYSLMYFDWNNDGEVAHLRPKDMEISG